MTEAVKLLSDDEVAKVAKRVAGNEPLRLYLAEFGIDVDALCQTVRALRSENERLHRHIKDLSHDFESSNKFCDEHHVLGSEY